MLISKKYIEMRQLGFSEYISLSQLENLSVNKKMNEIDEIKRSYRKRMIDKTERDMNVAINRELKLQIEKFEKIYGPEWLYITSNEPEFIHVLLKILQEGIKKDEYIKLIVNADPGYKKEYYKAIVDSIGLSRKDAESYFHVLMEILRINKGINCPDQETNNTKIFL